MIRYVHNQRLHVTLLTKSLKLNTQQMTSPMDRVAIGVSYTIIMINIQYNNSYI